MQMTIHVPDGLKSRMDSMPKSERKSWSAIASDAFANTLRDWTSKQTQKEQPMEHVIDRLRASKAEHESESFVRGKELGEDWATRQADYSELQNLVNAESSSQPYGIVNDVWNNTPEDCVFEALYPDENDRERENIMAFRDTLFQNEHAEHESANWEFWSGFVEGALTIWDRVSDKV